MKNLLKIFVSGLFVFGSLFFAQNAFAATGDITLSAPQGAKYQKLSGGDLLIYTDGDNIYVTIKWETTGATGSVFLKKKNPYGSVETISSGVSSGELVDHVVLDSDHSDGYDAEIQLFDGTTLLKTKKLYTQYILGVQDNYGNTDGTPEGYSALSANIFNINDPGFPVNNFKVSFQGASGSEYSATFLNTTGVEFASTTVASLAGNTMKGVAVNVSNDVLINYSIMRVCSNYPSTAYHCGPWKDLGSANNPVPKPNLTASAPTETTAEIGVPKTFTSTITNEGNKSTETSFSNLFQKATGIVDPENPTGLVDHEVSPKIPALDIGATDNISHAITFSASGIYYVRVCADKTSSASVQGTVPPNGAIIDESNENDNCSDWTRVSVSLPDLVASKPIQTGVVLGTNTSINSIIKNQGVSSTGTEFYNLFQITTGINDSEDPNLDGLEDHRTDLMPTLSSSNGSNTKIASISSSTLFANATANTTYYIRACADKSDRNDTGDITESIETNNCSGWQTVRVEPPGSIVGILAGDDCVIEKDQSTCPTTLTWEVINPIPLADTAVTDNDDSTSLTTSPHTAVVHYSDTTFYLYHNEIELKTLTLSATCTRFPVITEWSPSEQKCVEVGAPVVGSCNNTHWNCDTGTSLVSSQTGGVSGPSWTWTCQGLNGGGNNNCKEEVGGPVVGLCNNTHWNCLAGTSINHAGTGPWTWTCQGLNGGGNNNCKEEVGGPVVGLCNNTHWNCLAGTSINHAGTGPWTWTCQGLNGGGNNNCKEEVGGPINITFWPDPAKIFKGASSTLKWTSDAESCTAVNNEIGFGAWNMVAGNPANGSVPVNLTTTTNYKIKCTNSDGAYGTATATITVNGIKIWET